MGPDLPLHLLLAGCLISALSGVPGLFLPRGTSLGQPIATSAMGIAALLGLVGACTVLLRGSTASASFDWAIPGGEFALQADALSSFFLVPVFLIGALGSIYGHGYWRHAEHSRTATQLRFFYGLLVSGMGILLLAQNSLLFLMGWEVMALSSFFLIRIEDHLPAARDAGWLYLLATHIGTLALFGMFALLRGANGSFALVSLPEDTRLLLSTSIFLLALLSFGLKAGLMPFHVWLPDAHASAPSHVSALMSGVVIKMGIYGLIRTCTLLPRPPVSWGALLVLLGAASGVLGVAFAIGQHDLKRLLAYHSIENIGIIAIGLGLAMVGKSLGRSEWIVLGLAGCLLHVWNHGCFKALLFLGAGSVIHAVRTREIDRMGGLAKTMPRTALLFLIGSIAICGLPPLNGFVSEFLIYIGLFKTIALDGKSWTQAALAAPVLAMIGALAVACFVKVFGSVFLGTARCARTESARESPASMLGPMVVLASCCIAIGFAPQSLAPILDSCAAAWAPGLVHPDHVLSSLAPLGWISTLAAALTVLAAGAILLLGFSSKRVPMRAAETWSCGYSAPARRMQYTSSSFGEILVRLFAWALRPRTHRPRIEGLFPRSAHFESHVDDTVLVSWIQPASRASFRFLSRFRFLQQGRVQQYLLYVLLTVIVLLLWSIPLSDYVMRLFQR